MSDVFVQNAKSGKWEAPKDPDATLDYWELWDEWLDAVGDLIIGHQVILTPSNPASTVVLVTSMIVGGKRIVAWIRGGLPRERVAVTFRIFTNSTPQRIDDRTCYLKIKDR